MSQKNTDRLAFDRASVRTIDTAGRMHVEITNISKAVVNPYYGREIPNSEALGLDPNKVYMLLRDPQELEAGAATFNNIPLLSKHIPVTVDDPQKEIVVGSTGTDAVFQAPYLKNSLVIWDAVAIAGVDSREQCELSSAYWYDADMTPGVYENTPYDGVMRNIRGNHVALVEVGRAGSDVVVGDSQLSEYSNMKVTRKSIAVKAAIGAYLRPKLAQDAAIGDLGALVRSVKAATIAQDKARIAKDIQSKVKGKLAQDVELDTAELAQIIEMAAADESDEDLAADEDDDEDKEGDSDEVKAEKAKRRAAKAKQAQDEEDAKAAQAAKDEAEKPTKAAMDSAIRIAQDSARRDAIASFAAIREAEKAVAPFIGEVVAQDSAEAVYKLALDAAGIDLAGVHPSAYRAMVKMLPKPGAEIKPRIAQDSGVDFAKLFGVKQ
ncbi:DUF2213 domain-containing protein [Pandoraea apista]|uniref:DUF2213 domain-containing protein n=1 Tax=Pandoraea apista TaxID=93218 RepID=UPI002F933609